MIIIQTGIQDENSKISTTSYITNRSNKSDTITGRNTKRKRDAQLKAKKINVRTVDKPSKKVGNDIGNVIGNCPLQSI